MRLKGRVALITGASRGVGLAIAKAYAAEGAKLAICARSQADIQLAAKGLGPKVLGVGADVSDPAQAAGLVRAVMDRYGRIDVLVNNAGDAISAPIEKTSPELWARMIASNLTSAFLCCRDVFPIMRKQGGGRIINNASIAGKIGGKYIAAYSASKHGVVGLTRSLAQEGSEYGIACNAICPGYLDTPLTERSIRNITHKTGMTVSQARRMLENENPQRRLIAPEEVAAVAVFLASDEAGAITGEAINIW